MKIWVIMQRATEYNDEGDEVQEDGAKIYKAFRNKPTQEQIDAAAWDAIKGKTPSCDSDGWPDDMAYAEEIEVDEGQIVNPEVPVPQKKKESKGAVTYAEARLQAAQARAEAAKLAKDAIYNQAKVIFDQYPDLESFSWTQYTPHFNDGDECVFAVHSDYPVVKFKGFETFDENEGTDPGTVLYYRSGASDKVYVVKNDYSDKRVTFSYGRRGSSLVTGVKLESGDYSERSDAEKKLISEKEKEGYGNPIKEIKEFLSSIEDDDMKSVFGDHVEITATREGFEVEEYSHD